MEKNYRSLFNQTVLNITAALLLFLVSWSSQALANDLDVFKGLAGKLDIAGGTAHIPIMNEAAKRVMTAYSDIRITVSAGGSGVGVQKVGEGIVDIGNTGRAVSEDEIAKYGLKTFPVAIDGVAIIVHPQNQVKALTSQQVVDIYGGKIKNWKEVGGDDLPIHLYTRDESSGTREVFWEKALKKGTIAESANVVVSQGAMKLAVSQDIGGIGYTAVGFLDNTVLAVDYDGIKPSIHTVTDGSYKIARKLYMNTKGEPNPISKAFISYILSPDGQAIVQQSGYVTITK